MTTLNRFATGEASATSFNNNSTNIELTENLVHGRGVVTGFTLSIGTGLTVNVAAGTALIDGYVAGNAFSGLVVLANSTNYVWLKQPSTPHIAATTLTAASFHVAQTYTPPAGISVYLGTATTDGTTVTAVANDPANKVWVTFVTHSPTTPATSKKGDLWIDTSARARLKVCTVAGTPGTFVLVAQNEITPDSTRDDAAAPPTTVTTYHAEVRGFAADVDDILYVCFTVPDWVDVSKNLTVMMRYTMSTAEDSDVSMNLSYKCVASGEDATPAAYDATVEDEINVVATAETLTTFTGTNLKIATGNYAIGDAILCKLWRDVDGVVDNHTGVFELWKIWLEEAA